jgi:hypothetical protein
MEMARGILILVSVVSEDAVGILAPLWKKLYIVPLSNSACLSTITANCEQICEQARM